VSAVQRFTRVRPCPICKGYAEMQPGMGEWCWGFTSRHGNAAFCVREEHAGSLQAHRTSIGDVCVRRLHGPFGCGDTHGAPLMPQYTET
jgi:hypothetical protein